MIKISRPQLMTLLEVKHFRKGKCIWAQYNVPNTWHQEGQEFILSNSFDTDYGGTIPEFYYLGLDNRTTLAVTDTMASLAGEPTGDGYQRQAFSSTIGFTIAADDSDAIVATSGIATFVATISQWGPVRNAFLTTQTDDDGYLIASAALSSQRTVIAGDSISVRINLSLAGCS